jgi:CRP-like cAMP-binding protein
MLQKIPEKPIFCRIIEREETTPDIKVAFKDHLETHYGVDDREWDVIQDRSDVLELPKGEYFVRQGSICRKLAFIAEGVMRYLRFEPSGDETTCYFMCENDFVGDPASFETQKPSEMNLQAITSCSLVTLTFEQMQTLTRELPRFRSITASIDRKTSMDLLRQRDLLINRDAAAKYQLFVEQYPHILQRVPLGHVASFLDITQQSLSRLRKQLL